MNKDKKPRKITGFSCCDGIWLHADWCTEPKPKRDYETGDKVICPDTNREGIVIHCDYIKNEGGIEARCLVHITHEETEFENPCYIVEGNLIPESIKSIKP